VKTRNWNYDTWTPWTQQSAPLYLTLTLNPSFAPLRKYFGTPLFHSLIVFEHGSATWIFRPDEAAALGQRMIDYLQVPAHRNAFEDEVAASLVSLESALIRAMSEANQTHHSAPSLLSEFRALEAAYTRFYRLAAFIEPVQVAAQRLLTVRIQATADSLALSTGADSREIAASAYALDEESYAANIDRSLRDIASSLVKETATQAGLRDEISGLQSEKDVSRKRFKAAEVVKLLEKRETETSHLICRHIEMYSWSDNNYARCFDLTATDVVLKVSNYGPPLVAHETLRTEIAKSEANRARGQELKTLLLPQLSVYEANVLAIHDLVGARLLDTRKRVVLKTNGVFTHLLSAIARRLDLAVEDLIFLLPQELDAVVRSPDRYVKRFALRKEAFLVYQADFSVLDEEAFEGIVDFEPHGDPYIAEGEAMVDEIFSRLSDRLNILVGKPASGDEIQGFTAFYHFDTPRMTGTVAVIRDPATDIIPPGSILVAASTTPDYMSAIHRCSAIVTDWGGQTSHAAITARELGKPCIIGTNYGSFSLRNGETVELDFEHGVVRRQVVQGAES